MYLRVTCQLSIDITLAFVVYMVNFLKCNLGSSSVQLMLFTCNFNRTCFVSTQTTVYGQHHSRNRLLTNVYNFVYNFYNKTVDNTAITFIPGNGIVHREKCKE